MIKIEIAGQERLYHQIDDEWIRSQIQNRRKDGREVCVRVYVEYGNIYMMLSTPGCQSTGRRSKRQYRECEKPLSEKWEEMGLRRPDYSPGALIKFLKYIEKYS